MAFEFCCRSSIALQKLNITCQFNSTVGFYKSLINGVRQHPAGFVACPFPANRRWNSTLCVDDLYDLANVSGRHMWNKGTLRKLSRIGGSIFFAPGVVADPRPNLNSSTGLGGKQWGWCLCVDSLRDGRPPGARGGIQKLGTGQDLWFV